MAIKAPPPPPLQDAVAKAAALEAKFQDTGTGIAIAVPGGVELPFQIRKVLETNNLRAYFGLTAKDAEMAAFLADKLGVEAVVVTSEDGCDTAIGELDGTDLVGIDIETAVPGAPPPTIKLNKNGTIQETQKRNNDDPSPAATDPLRAQIMCVQLYAGFDKAFIFLGRAKDRLLARPWLRRQRLVAHNAAFETIFLKHAGFVSPYPIDCTMQLSGLAYGSPRRLADTTKHVLGITPPKEFGASYWAAERLGEGQIPYAAADPVLAWICGVYLLPRVRRSRYLKAYELQRDAAPIVAAMQTRGLGFDREEHARQIAEWRGERDAARACYIEIKGKEPPKRGRQTEALVADVATTSQLQQWPPTPTGKRKTDRASLKILNDDPAIAALLKFRANDYLINSQFGAKLSTFPHPLTGRLHASYITAGAITGRFTCRQPNLQQLPRTAEPRYRKIIVAERGNRLIVGDLSMIELRAFAEISDCVPMRDALAAGRDLHRETASAISGVPYERVSDAQRDYAKPVNFGAIYGIGAKRLAQDARDNYGIAMSETEATAALDAFEEKFPSRGWMHRHFETCRDRGYIEIADGRTVHVSWINSGQFTFNQCCNFPPQGAAANVLLRAIILIGDRLPGALIAIVHDEVVLEVPEAQAEAAGGILAEVMTEAFSATFPGAPTLGLIEIGIGANWHDAKENAKRRPKKAA